MRIVRGHDEMPASPTNHLSSQQATKPVVAGKSYKSLARVSTICVPGLCMLLRNCSSKIYKHEG
jgi:hypothetical protein